MQLLGSVLESKPISELFKESRENLARIKLETKFKLDETEEARETPRISTEAAKGAMGSDELPERISTSADTKLEIEQAKEMMGEEGEERDEVAKLEIEEAEGMEEKMQTGPFFDMYCGGLKAVWSWFFSSRCNDTTSLSPMHFTHITPGSPSDAAFVASTLQIFSVKVAEIKEALEFNWPLHVYGMVAARDTVDHSRNILFVRRRSDCQILTQKDPCLQLTGPSRAIVAIDPVHFEIKLKVKGRSRSEDRVLIHQTFNYSGNETTLSNDFCKIMLRCAKLENTVQATIVSVRVTNWRKRKWPFKHDGRVSCIAKRTSKPDKPEQPEEELLLQDQVTANSSDGYLDLSRHVVSVELNGKLEVIISADKSRAPNSCGRVLFPAQESKVSRRTCNLGSHKVEITVAWSLLIRDKRDISREGCVDGQTFEHSAKIRGRKHAVTTLETHSATNIVRAKIYSLLNLISEKAVNLKPEPKLRISDYSTSEVQIHMDNMYTDVTSLLQMEKVQGNAIFNWLDQLCTQLDQIKLEVEETKEMGGEAKDSYETKEMGGEAKDSYEASLRISTSMETKLETEEVEEMGEDANMDKEQTDEEYFASYRTGWVSIWSRFHGSFTETTSLSPMQYTHITPGQRPFAALVDSTLQIYSLKVAEIEDGSGLKWPLEVYGVVAARDTVDQNRNILFSRRRSNCQILTQEDPFLRLTGPSRAIVTREPANVEIELKVKGRTKSEDKPLMSFFGSHGGLRTLYTPLEGDFCTMVISSEEVYESVQATVVGIRVCVPEEVPSLFENGGRVVCFSLPRRRATLPDSEHRTDPSFRQVVLQDGAMTSCSQGYLDLSRHVVAVGLRGTLEVLIEANSQSGAMAAQVSIQARDCNITQNECQLGDSKLEITVAWSRLVRDKLWITREANEELR